MRMHTPFDTCSTMTIGLVGCLSADFEAALGSIGPGCTNGGVGRKRLKRARGEPYSRVVSARRRKNPPPALDMRSRCTRTATS